MEVILPKRFIFLVRTLLKRIFVNYFSKISESSKFVASKGLQETSKLYSKGKEKISELELGEKVSALSEDAKILIAEKMNSQPEVQNKIDQSQSNGNERFISMKKSNPMEISKKSPVRVDIHVDRLTPAIENKISSKNILTSRLNCVIS